MPAKPPPLDFYACIDAGAREHYADAALYDFEYRRRRADVTFYRQLAKRAAAARTRPLRILELGAGSGRVTLPLARDGHDVVAVDQSEAMLAKLSARAAQAPKTVRQHISVSPGDLRTFDLPGKRFDLVIAPFNVFEHLYTRPEFHAALLCVRKHLGKGGQFAFDVQLPDLEWLTRDPARRWARTKFTHPSTGAKVMYSTNHVYDPITQIAVIRIYYEPAEGKGPSHIVTLSQRKYFPAELESLVHYAGFRVLERYGDFAWQPIDDISMSQVLLCAPA